MVFNLNAHFFADVTRLKVKNEITKKKRKQYYNPLAIKSKKYTSITKGSSHRVKFDRSITGNSD